MGQLASCSTCLHEKDFYDFKCPVRQDLTYEFDYRTHMEGPIWSLSSANPKNIGRGVMLCTATDITEDNQDPNTKRSVPQDTNPAVYTVQMYKKPSGSRLVVTGRIRLDIPPKASFLLGDDMSSACIFAVCVRGVSCWNYKGHAFPPPFRSKDPVVGRHRSRRKTFAEVAKEASDARHLPPPKYNSSSPFASPRHSPPKHVSSEPGEVVGGVYACFYLLKKDNEVTLRVCLSTVLPTLKLPLSADEQEAVLKCLCGGVGRASPEGEEKAGKSREKGEKEKQPPEVSSPSWVATFSEAKLASADLSPIADGPSWIDFALLDDGGAHLQLDTIVRSKSTETLRVRLQEICSVNADREDAEVAIGFSDLPTALPSATAAVQALYVSDRRLSTSPPKSPADLRALALARQSASVWDDYPPPVDPVNFRWVGEVFASELSGLLRRDETQRERPFWFHKRLQRSELSALLPEVLIRRLKRAVAMEERRQKGGGSPSSRKAGGSPSSSSAARSGSPLSNENAGGEQEEGKEKEESGDSSSSPKSPQQEEEEAERDGEAPENSDESADSPDSSVRKLDAEKLMDQICKDPGSPTAPPLSKQGELWFCRSNPMRGYSYVATGTNLEQALSMVVGVRVRTTTESLRIMDNGIFLDPDDNGALPLVLPTSAGVFFGLEEVGAGLLSEGSHRLNPSPAGTGILRLFAEHDGLVIDQQVLATSTEAREEVSGDPEGEGGAEGEGGGLMARRVGPGEVEETFASESRRLYLRKTLVHQEIVESRQAGMWYRVTIVWPDGRRQTASLDVPRTWVLTDDASPYDYALSTRRRSSDVVESPMWPISFDNRPMESKMDRILLYTRVRHEPVLPGRQLNSAMDSSLIRTEEDGDARLQSAEGSPIASPPLQTPPAEPAEPASLENPTPQQSQLALPVPGIFSQESLARQSEMETELGQALRSSAPATPKMSPLKQALTTMLEEEKEKGIGGESPQPFTSSSGEKRAKEGAEGKEGENGGGGAGAGAGAGGMQKKHSSFAMRSLSACESADLWLNRFYSIEEDQSSLGLGEMVSDAQLLKQPFWVRPAVEHVLAASLLENPIYPWPPSIARIPGVVRSPSNRM
uniref:Uncharacterized protein n=1 Tax=Chromera velia CCMP2878 TaxID=1169474 RepID=A0A0G4HES4_9ALVE|eukprot:Cvel_26726.t1-p1 / transcript=Cvel_26726.t1 / gene=Cvel_26726 / organism=Chromera_velia_CCMP2878 / gene_product=hypothetical protein / transcript_product=hypothetical protein / location=Cvel_scaffold3225:3921-10831(-) / protein_length=1102 / sequence_SO=supercontig / SO=protein_coding / is_pseudo=false